MRAPMCAAGTAARSPKTAPSKGNPIGNRAHKGKGSAKARDCARKGEGSAEARAQLRVGLGWLREAAHKAMAAGGCAWGWDGCARWHARPWPQVAERRGGTAARGGAQGHGGVQCATQLPLYQTVDTHHHKQASPRTTNMQASQEHPALSNLVGAWAKATGTNAQRARVHARATPPHITSTPHTGQAHTHTAPLLVPPGPAAAAEAVAAAAFAAGPPSCPSPTRLGHSLAAAARLRAQIQQRQQGVKPLSQGHFIHAFYIFCSIQFHRYSPIYPRILIARQASDAPLLRSNRMSASGHLWLRRPRSSFLLLVLLIRHLTYKLASSRWACAPVVGAATGGMAAMAYTGATCTVILRPAISKPLKCCAALSAMGLSVYCSRCRGQCLHKLASVWAYSGQVHSGGVPWACVPVRCSQGQAQCGRQSASRRARGWAEVAHSGQGARWMPAVGARAKVHCSPAKVHACMHGLGPDSLAPEHARMRGVGSIRGRAQGGARPRVHGAPMKMRSGNTAEAGGVLGRGLRLGPQTTLTLALPAPWDKQTAP